ncbi:MAG: PDZ domain-containing protein, partial [Planctomycetes bacterium]|nr:PDZ domain-containing protein [Planctomycetota bacterium]
QAAGVRDGDIILGFDNKPLEINSYDFLGYVRRTYIVGDRVKINILRDGKRLNLPMTLKPF